MIGKKGQERSAGGAAALVTIITLLIIVYILFVPPSERGKILGINETTGTETSNGTENVVAGIEHNKTLLSVQPGKISYLPQKTIEHDLPSVDLYTKTEGLVIGEVNSIAVKKALFAEKTQNFTFSINNLNYAKNVLLSFNLVRGSGELIIKLNGNEIFNKAINGNTEPIKLPNELLKINNVLEFEASDVGLVFWKVNNFMLDNIKVTADITDTAASESKSIFLVSKSERDNLDKASIKFYAGCDMNNVGRLFIEINGNNVFTGIPDCGQLISYEFSPEKLIQGENVVRINTDKGHYLIDRIAVNTQLITPEQYIWFFQLDDTEYNQAKNNSISINLSVEFSDDSYKEGYFIINNQQVPFSTTDTTYSRIINPFIRSAGNTIKLEPESNMFITDLRVVIT